MPKPFSTKPARSLPPRNAPVPPHADLAPLTDAAAQLREAAQRTAPTLRALETSVSAPAQHQQVNLALAAVEQSFLSPEGLPGRPWYKHQLWAPGSYAGYTAVMMPSLAEAIEHKDAEQIRRATAGIATVLTRATSKLNEISRLAPPVRQPITSPT